MILLVIKQLLLAVRWKMVLDCFQFSCVITVGQRVQV